MKDSIKICSKCRQSKPVTEFYIQTGRDKPMAYCKACVNQSTLDRICVNRTKAIKRKGGKCIRCGYEGCESVFDFHHPDPSIKEKGVGHLLSRSWTKVSIEIDKCELMCANCHRLTHCHHERCSIP